MGLLICKKYGKVDEEACSKCKDRNNGASCTNFIMLASNAKMYGCLKRVETRDAQGKATMDVTQIDEKGEEAVSKVVESRQRKIKLRRML